MAKDYAKGRVYGSTGSLCVQLENKWRDGNYNSVKALIREVCAEAYNDGAKQTKQRILGAQRNHKRGQKPKAVWICWDERGHFVEFTSCEPRAACFYDRYELSLRKRGKK